MDVGDDRDVGGAADRRHRQRRFDVGARDADDIDADFLALTDLVDRRVGVFGRRVGHGLHRDHRAAADGHLADHDLARRAARNVAPRTNAHRGCSGCMAAI